jgi:hypothetical protein
MKRSLMLVIVLALAILACGINSATPAADIHTVQTIAAATLAVLAPTQNQPPTLIPVPTLTFVPNAATPIWTSGPAILATSSGSGATRIEFAPGGISATVIATVTFPNQVNYVLRAMKNQQMRVQITSPGDAANFAIRGVSDNQPLKRFENEDRAWTGTLPGTQDYLISVAVANGSALFTLTITIV